MACKHTTIDNHVHAFMVDSALLGAKGKVISAVPMYKVAEENVHVRVKGQTCSEWLTLLSGPDAW